jgi:2-C-methyl-D-erythritol 2,4-cyclodiphosphate synthase
MTNNTSETDLNLTALPFRIGHGYDVHRFADEAEMDAQVTLGGVKIAHSKKLLAHSDGDVLIHALCDALLGAMAKGDIGHHFPDTDPAYNGINSAVLLQKTYELVQEAGYKTGNIDITIVAQKPVMKTHIPDMRAKLARLLSIDIGQINIKATTTEGLGFSGREEGIAVHAVAIVYKS